METLHVGAFSACVFKPDKHEILIRQRGWFGLKFTDPVEVMAPLGTMAERMCFAYNEL